MQDEEQDSVDELSSQLSDEMRKNDEAARAERLKAAIADHIAGKPGPARVLEVDPDGYHKLPGLSQSIATTLVSQSPLHAFTEHPCFGAANRSTSTKEMDIGTVGHTLVLGKGKRFEALAFRDYKTKAAQQARDNARAEGRVPILERELAAARATAARVIGQLAERGIVLNGHSEVAVEWWEPTEYGHVRCRAMFDHVFFARAQVIDLKFVGDASQSAVERSSENFGYAIQAAAYRRALVALHPQHAGREDFLFAFCEKTSPHAMNLTRPDGQFRELGERRWQRAVNTWAACLTTNTWPAYGTGVNPLSPPGWALAREEAAA